MIGTALRHTSHFVTNAANMLKESDAESKVVILLTDGVNNAGQIDPLTAAEAANSLGIIFFAILFGYFMTHLEDEYASPLYRFWDAVFHVMMRMTEWIMKFAPIGVFGLVAGVIAETGYKAAGPLATFAVVVILALAVHAFVTLPLLLPWLPGRSFALKGAVVGLMAGLLLFAWGGTGLSLPESGALLGGIVVASSYLGMNFTGSTPYTSPSGVEWEMRRAIPVQFFLAAGALVLWVGTPLVLAWG